MTFFSYVIAMIIGTVLSWFAWLQVLIRVSPYEAGLVGLFLFYGSLLLSLLGTFSLVGLIFRHLKVRKKFLVEKVVTSFRQGFWFGVVIVISLILQRSGQLSWWNVLLVVLIAAVIEFFFLSAMPNVSNPLHKNLDRRERFI